MMSVENVLWCEQFLKSSLSYRDFIKTSCYPFSHVALFAQVKKYKENIALGSYSW
jgi:hypothetical protein